MNSYIAKLESICALCRRPVRVGDEVSPYTRRVWAHTGCAEAALRTRWGRVPGEGSEPPEQP